MAHFWLSDPVLPEFSRNRVYHPDADTYILCEALEMEKERILKLNPSIILEVGSGSGFVSGFIGKLIGPAFQYATDINPFAIMTTRTMFEINEMPRSDCVLSDITQGFPLRVNPDLIVFNPPYVLTPNTEVGIDPENEESYISAALAGGESDGRNIIDPFLEAFPKDFGGLCYLVVIAENDVGALPLGTLEAEEIIRRNAGSELLIVLRISGQSTGVD